MENREDNTGTCETQKDGSQKEGRLSYRLIRIAYDYERSILVASVWFAGPAAESSLVLCTAQGIWLSPFKSLVLTSSAPSTLKGLSLFKKFASTASCLTPQVKPRYSNGRIARAFFCWTVVP